MKRSSLTKSPLGSKVSICHAIETLTIEQADDVLKLIKKELDCTNTNQLIAKLLFFKTQQNNEIFSPDSLASIENYVQHMPKPASATTTKSVSINSNDCDVKKDVSSTKNTRDVISGLPDEILSNIGSYINEKDIINYEQCSRRFLTLCHTFLFLKKRSKYRTLSINRKNLEYISKNKCCLNRYVNCGVLTFNLDFKVGTLAYYCMKSCCNGTQMQVTTDHVIERIQRSRKHLNNPRAEYYG